MKKIYLLIVLTFCFSYLSFGQTVNLYTENFTGQNGKGYNGSTTDLSGVTWSIDIAGSNPDYFYVTGGEFEGKETDGNATWYSPSIAITGYSNISFSLNVSSTNNDNPDTFTTQYRLNGTGSWTSASNNGNITNDFSGVVSQTGLTGTSIQIRVIMNNDNNNETYTFDNVVVVGTLPCATYTLPFTEGFESGAPPTCWASYRGTNNLGTAMDWTTTTTAQSGSLAAYVQFEDVTGGTAEDWLVTPAINLSTTTNNTLTFWTRDTYTNNYNTTYTIRVSTTSQTNRASFTTVQTYNEAQLGNAYNQKSIVLPAIYNTGTVYVAFVMSQDDGDDWLLDDVSITGTQACTTIPSDVTDLAATTGSQQVDMTWTNGACFDDVLVVAKAGSVVTAIPTGDGTSYIPNPFFGTGIDIAPDEFVVYKGTGTGVTTTNLVNGTTYYFKAFTRKGTNWSSGVGTSVTPILAYCLPTEDPGIYGTSIRLVQFGSINNSTPNRPDGGAGYQDFTAQSTTVVRGSSETLTVNVDTDDDTGVDYDVIAYAWIDWNGNGDFTDAGENYNLGTAAGVDNGPTTDSPLSINIPPDASLGAVRMRVLCQYYDVTPPAVDPCVGPDDGEVEDYTINITESVNYIFDMGIWSPADPNGIAASSDNINIIEGNAVITTNTTVGNIVVSPLGALTVNSGTVLEVSGALNMESNNLRYSSLMADGVILGTVNYNRHVNAGTGLGVGSGANDLISSPLVSSQNFGAFASQNANIKSDPADNNRKLFGPFNKINGQYQIYNTNIPADANSELTPGVGFRAASTDNLGFTFTGSVNQGIVTNNIVYTTTPGVPYKPWNLVGNPYPTYINVFDFLNYVVDSGSGVKNVDLLDLFGAAVYGYDGNGGNGWTVWNFNTPTKNIAPGQGFFVQVDPTQVDAGDLTFAPMMRVIGNTDDFIPGRASNVNNLHLKLRAVIGASGTFHTDFYFNDSSTSGLDRGYDAVVYGHTATPKSIYSQLAADNTGLDLAIQSLATEALGSDIVVPLGINAAQGQQVTVSIAESDLPSDIQVYLEDTVTGIFTLLNTGDYIFTPGATLNSTGRFFLRFSEQTLSNPDTTFNRLQIFTTTSPRILFVKGQLVETTRITLYDVQGRVVLSSELEASSNSNKVDVSNLDSGVYVVQLNNNTQQKTQKVILK